VGNQPISVIIATKNRAEALRTVSLPSLAAQKTRDFEVIVWDASEGSATRFVTESSAVQHAHLKIRHFQAPRAGLTAQRNDAVEEAAGDIVFFIDDDSEVSPEGIGAIQQMFATQPDLAGGCLPLDYRWPGGDEKPPAKPQPVTAFLLKAYLRLFYPSMRVSGVYKSFLPKKPGPIEYLTGCDMAFRKSVFRRFRFDERLQRFGGYALLEDQLFSHQLKREGLSLAVAERGMVVHHAAMNGREGNPFNQGRMEAYNAAIVWKTSILPYEPWTIAPFIWARIGFAIIILLPCIRRPWKANPWKRLAGYFEGLWVFAAEQLQETRLRIKRRNPVASV
jgi:glycosyltransferase involved in cell wall biosynthesis